MLTQHSLFRTIRRVDYFTSVDLKDAFFHVPIVERHRKYLRFAFQNKAYEFCVLPFGLSLSPWTFTACVNAALPPLREKGIQIYSYLDDESHAHQNGDRSPPNTGLPHKLEEKRAVASWPLPVRTDLLSQEGGEIFHLSPHKWKLVAWFLNGNVC